MAVLTNIPNNTSARDWRDTVNALIKRIAALEAAGVPVEIPAPAFTTQPSISPTSGTAGSTLYAATPGTVSNGSVVSRVWLLNGVAISNGVTALPASSGTLAYQETASGPGGTTTSTVQVAAVTAATVTPTPAPSFTSQPSIGPNTGTAGTTTFTATAGNISNGSITSRSWTINGTVISTGLTASPASSGTLTYQETATGPGGTTQSTVQQVTVATAAAAAPAFTAQPTISPSTGTAGTTTYTATPGAVSNGTITSRAWALNGSTISTGLTATPASAGTLTYQEFATGSGGSASSSVLTRTVSAATPALAISPTVPSIASNAAAGTLVSNISNVPTGVTPTVTPNDGRLVIAGNASAGWKVVVGMSALSVGQINFSVAATGATSASGVLTVTAAGAVALRTIAVQNRMHTGKESRGTSDRQAFRWPIVIGQDASQANLWFSNWIHVGVPGPNGFPMELLGASLQKDDGTITVPITFAGARNLPMVDGANDLLSDPVSPSAFGLPKFTTGEIYYVKGILEFAPGSTVPSSQRSTGHYVGSQASFFTAANTTISSVDAPGLFTATGTALDGRSNGYCPMMMGMPVVDGPSFIEFGDSISEISGDGGEDTNKEYGLGFFQRSLHDAGTARTNLRAGILVARVGITASQVAQSEYWKPLLKYARYAIDALGTNDMAGGLAPLQSNLQVLWTAFKAAGLPIYRTNFLARTTSTNNWIDKAGQTPSFGWGAGEIRDQVNVWFNTKISDGTLAGVIDTLSAGTDPSDNHYWPTTGVENAATFDGTHPRTFIHEAMAAKVRAVIQGLTSTPEQAPTLRALIVSPSSATVGTAYSGTISGLTSGSSIALSGAGAAGLSIAGGVLTGTPTTTGAVNIIETLAGATGSPRTSSSVITVAAAASVALNGLTLSPTTATVGVAYSGTVSGKTSGSTLALSGAGAAGLTVSGSTVSGTPTTPGTVSIIETLAGATGSPRTSSGVITVAAAGGGSTVLFSDSFANASAADVNFTDHISESGQGWAKAGSPDVATVWGASGAQLISANSSGLTNEAVRGSGTQIPLRITGLVLPSQNYDVIVPMFLRTRINNQFYGIYVRGTDTSKDRYNVGLFTGSGSTSGIWVVRRAAGAAGSSLTFTDVGKSTAGDGKIAGDRWTMKVSVRTVGSDVNIKIFINSGSGYVLMTDATDAAANNPLLSGDIGIWSTGVFSTAAGGGIKCDIAPMQVISA